MADTKRRARGEDSIFFAPSRKCRVGEITVGWKPDGRRDRITVRGKTKTEVKDKLRAKHQELDASVRTPAHYTVQQCIEDWLDSLTTQSPATLTNYRNAAGHVIELNGSIKLADLKARDVQLAFTKLAKRKSTRSVRLYRMVLVRAIRHAQVNDLVMRNVAELIFVPAGQPGRPSKALTLEQALALLGTAKAHRLWAYVAVSLLGGLRTEEARALRWSEVDLEAGTVAVYRSVRLGGDTKTEKSRRFVQLPDIAVEALRALVLAQAADRAKAGTAWVENNLVFCRRTGTPLTDHDVWLQFRRITEKAGLGTDWSPRELRHTFVSLLSDSGVPIEQIADAVGHASTWTTENVYRHQLRPVLRTAATVLGPLFVGQENGSPSENLACHLGCLSLFGDLTKYPELQEQYGIELKDVDGMSPSLSGPLLPGAEPFEHAGGPVGVLLCHGFTGSPQTLRSWAEYVAAQDFTVSLPRLPGHGTNWQDMARTGWQDWYAEVDAAFAALASRCEQTFIFGISMGGCLALRLAEVHGREVRGLVLVNPSLAPDTRLFLVAPVLKHVLRTIPGVASDIKKPGVSEVGYDRVPIGAAATLPKLWDITTKHLSDVTQPVLVYRSTVDHVVGPPSMRVLLAGLPEDQVTVRECADSYHVATLDNDAETIFEGSVKFIQDHGDS